MLKNSVFFKPLLILLALSLSLTLLGIAAVNGRIPVNPQEDKTEVETGTDESATEPVLDPSVVFSHQSEGLQVFNRQTTTGSDLVRFYLGTGSLKPNTTYVLSWRFGDDLSNNYFGVSLGYLFAYGGKQTEMNLNPTNSDYIWENSVEITTPSTSAATVDFYFRVAEGTHDESTQPEYGYAEIILDNVEFWVREKGGGS